MHTHCHSAGSFRLPIRTFLLSLAALLVAGNVSFGQESRTWTDSTGKFTIVGKISSNDGKTLRIEKSDGKVVAIPVDKLSKADQEFLAKAAAENPFQEEEASPFQPEAPAMKNDDADDDPSPAAASGEPRNVNIRLNNVRKVAMQPQKDEFGIEVTPPAAVKFRTKPTSVPPTLQFFDGLDEMEVSANGRVLLSFGCDVRHIRRDNPRLVEGLTDDQRIQRYVLIDAASGKTLSEGKYAGDSYKVFALHDDGVRFAVRKTVWGHGKSGVLEIWAFNGPKTILRGFRLEPFAEVSWDPEKDVDWAEFVGDRLLVGNGKIVMALNATDYRPQYQLEMNGRPTITPDKKHAIFFKDKNLAVLDVATGKIVCAMPFDSNFAPTMGIDPQGKSLVCLSGNELTKFNLQNGQVEMQFTTTMSAQQARGLIVLNERYFLTPNGELFDMQDQIKVWSFTGAAKIRQLGDTTIFYKGEGNRADGAIVCQQLPGEKLAAHLDQLTKQPGFFCLEPGVKVRLDVEGLPDPQKKQEILASLFKKLEANGAIVDPNGQVVLKASVESKGPKEVRFFGGGNVTFQEFLSKLEMTFQGKTVWSRSGNNIPGILQYDQVEGMAAAAAKHNHPSYYLFEHAVIPRKVARPAEGNEVGATKVTVNGLQ
ncbi:hypothetical protein LOC68_13835 [Blastopirellula sp. JC732]|uniref:SLA1 homology domain-containing protein n=1 Tax=Blastopirellula sediminis TaxID=2894196 RepID=A0A9X1MMU1_9BACT|nr:SHD1 domain-containing protein [Blastopirellula sediminis]MCC9607231.1 hypothetical protein [Blastopirellula sediminis]MCC9629476.1 hypothetical protein [Blastopirellula sediminis]